MTVDLLVYADGVPVATAIDASGLLVYADGVPAGAVPAGGAPPAAGFPLQLFRRRLSFGCAADGRAAWYRRRKDEHGESQLT